MMLISSGKTKKHRIKEIQRLCNEGQYDRAFMELSGIAAPEDDFTLQSLYARIFRAMPHDAFRLQPIRIAILTTSTLDHFVDVFRFWLAMEGFAAEIYTGEINSLHQNVLDSDSSLYRFAPDVTWLFTNFRDVFHHNDVTLTAAELNDTVNTAIQKFAGLWSAIHRNRDCLVIQNNADMPVTRVFGNYSGAIAWSHLNLVRRFNIGLADALVPGVTIFDLAYLCSLCGARQWHSPRFWYHSKHAFDFDFFGVVAFQAARLVSSVRGRSQKCIVLDLDNTIWGGIVGDEGLEGIRIGSGADGEAFVDFQRYLLKLKERGIILAVCSKNEEEIAKKVFLEHPDMELQIEDIAVFKANWNDKAQNIQEIGRILNIGLDSMIFIDDSHVERALVRSLLPMVSVPEMPEDPAEYIAAIDRCCYFEAIAFSDEDRVRGEAYRANAVRAGLLGKALSLASFLQDLDMEAAMRRFDKLHVPRIAQLINKSNQFHLTTTRYSEAQIEAFMASLVHYCFFFRLKDRLGDSGVISALILKRMNESDLSIDTWVMSCRVLSRGMEEFIANELIFFAKETGFQRVLGKYIPTPKNILVANLYERLGFLKTAEDQGATSWEIDLRGELVFKECFIKKVPSSSPIQNHL